MRRVIVISYGLFCLGILASFSCYSVERNDEFTKDLAKALNAEQLSQYMYLEAIPDETVKINKSSVAFSIDKNQPKLNSGTRSELSINFPYKVGESVGYKFDMFIPASFMSDDLNRWSLLAQWHDQPNFDKGEVWKNHPKLSPPVFIFTESNYGSFGIGIQYGLNQRVWFPIQKNLWHQFEFRFLWSKTNEGKLQVLLNDAYKFSFEGQNMLNEYQHYLKVGLYRHPEIKGHNEIHFRNLSISKI